MYLIYLIPYDFILLFVTYYIKSYIYMYLHMLLIIHIHFDWMYFILHDALCIDHRCIYLIVSSTLFICLLVSILSKRLFDFIGCYYPLKHKRTIHHRRLPQILHVSIHHVGLIIVCAINIPIRED